MSLRLVQWFLRYGQGTSKVRGRIYSGRHVYSAKYSTVKPLLSGHSRETAKVAAYDRWPFNTGAPVMSHIIFHVIFTFCFANMLQNAKLTYKIPRSSRCDNWCPLSHAFSHGIFTFWYSTMLENAKLTWTKTILAESGRLIQVTVHHGRLILWPLAA